MKDPLSSQLVAFASQGPPRCLEFLPAGSSGGFGAQKQPRGFRTACGLPESQAVRLPEEGPDLDEEEGGGKQCAGRDTG